MAKRTSRSKTNEASSTPSPAQPIVAPKARRGRVSTAAGAQPRRGASTPAPRSESMTPQPSEEAIRLRAYQRYLERGGGHGMEFEDWLHAEQELKARR